MSVTARDSHHRQDCGFWMNQDCSCDQIARLVTKPRTLPGEGRLVTRTQRSEAVERVLKMLDACFGHDPTGWIQVLEQALEAAEHHRKMTDD